SWFSVHQCFASQMLEMDLLELVLRERSSKTRALWKLSCLLEAARQPLTHIRLCLQGQSYLHAPSTGFGSEVYAIRTSYVTPAILAPMETMLYLLYRHCSLPPDETGCSLPLEETGYSLPPKETGCSLPLKEIVAPYLLRRLAAPYLLKRLTTPVMKLYPKEKIVEKKAPAKNIVAKPTAALKAKAVANPKAFAKAKPTAKAKTVAKPACF
ncbi:hypothetical protein Tco_1269661, partial [Tanacetum coccineum]